MSYDLTRTKQWNSFFCAHVFNDETFVSFVISGALVGSALQLDITLRL